tara:strand:+ start:1320 stop:1907 length:588 start_codon:yes stop_codon:yes gene_type:complete
MDTPASDDTPMATRLTLDFRRMACCSGPCNKTAPLRDSEPGQYRWDGLMYAGHSRTLYVVRGYQCSACYRRYREFWEAFDWAVEKKDTETMFSIEEWFECDIRAITSKFKSITPGALHYLCDSESSDSQRNPSTPPALGTIYEERIKKNSVYLPVFTHHAARQRMHALQKICKRRRHGHAPSAPSRHERRRLRYA